MSSADSTTGWNTNQEILFIEGLGKHSELDHKSVLDLLHKYQAAMANRVNWGGMNLKRISMALEQRIDEVRRHL